MSRRFSVEVYDGSQHPAPRPYRTEEHRSERAARRAAARMLGHATLRGASSWERYQGGTVWQFGPRDAERNEYDFAVIEEG